MSLNLSTALIWFDDKTPEQQFAAYSLVAFELGEPLGDVSPKILEARRSEVVRLWHRKLDERYHGVDRETLLDNLRVLLRQLDNDWKADFQRHGFLPKDDEWIPLRADDEPPGGASTASPLALPTRRLIRAGLLSEATAILSATYLLEEEGFEEVTTSQVTGLLKEEGILATNASATIQSLAQKKADPDLEIIGKSNRGKRLEWLFRLTPAAHRRTGERLRINAGEAAP